MARGGGHGSFRTYLGQVDVDIVPLLDNAIALGSSSKTFRLVVASTGNFEVPVAIADGGTGSGTAAGARTNLGIGTIATQNSPLAINSGGTGAITAGSALVALGAVPDTFYARATSQNKIIVWTDSRTCVAGFAQFAPTTNADTTGTAIFSNIMGVQAIALSNTNVLLAQPIASLKQISADFRTVEVNVMIGKDVPVGGGTPLAVASDGVVIYTTIFGV